MSRFSWHMKCSVPKKITICQEREKHSYLHGYSKTQITIRSVRFFVPETWRGRFCKRIQISGGIGFPIRNFFLKSFEKKIRAIGKSCMMAGNDIGQHITV